MRSFVFALVAALALPAAAADKPSIAILPFESPNEHSLGEMGPNAVEFFQVMFGATVVWDEMVAGARGIRLQIGRAFILIYDQPPGGPRGGAFHHLGIATDDLARASVATREHEIVDFDACKRAGFEGRTANHAIELASTDFVEDQHARGVVSLGFDHECRVSTAQVVNPLANLVEPRHGIVRAIARVRAIHN